KDAHPYFKLDSMARGTLMYDSVQYDNLPMYFDIVKEQVIINDPFKIYKLHLINEKVNAFTLFGHNFIRLEPDSVNRKIINPGFYDQLYKGKVNLYEKEIK